MPSYAAYLFQCLSLRLNIGSRIVVGGVEACMSEPIANYRHVDAGAHKADGNRVPKSVRGDVLGEQ